MASAVPLDQTAGSHQEFLVWNVPYRTLFSRCHGKIRDELPEPPFWKQGS
jgi:hypothetical protein